MSLYLGENCISAGGSSAFRNTNIGEIIQSTIPLSDAGLHLLDGSVISGNGAYSAFVTHIAGLVSGHSELFETEANWQQAVTDYGVCGKFVYDSVNNTVRLPKITGFTEGIIDPTVLGDLTQAGLPNITGSFQIGSGNAIASYSQTGAFYGTDSSTNDRFGGGSTSNTYRTTNIDASRSSSIYGNSSTVQPQSIKVLYYIVIATSTKTDIQVDIDEIATDLNGKADVDFQNCTFTPMRSDVVHIVETYVNGTSWYRIYSDGWCEQGGQVTNADSQTVILAKQYANTNYSVIATQGETGKYGSYSITVGARTTTSFPIYISYNHTNVKTMWEAKGYIS